LLTVVSTSTAGGSEESGDLGTVGAALADGRHTGRPRGRGAVRAHRGAAATAKREGVLTMGMSESEYQRVVEELKASRAHDPANDLEQLKRRAEESTLKLWHTALWVTISNLRFEAQQAGPAHSTSVTRALALEARAKALPPTRSTTDRLVPVGRLCETVTRTSTPDVFDRVLAAIDVELQLAEAR
jgi:hypothetical protein